MFIFKIFVRKTEICKRVLSGFSPPQHSLQFCDTFFRPSMPQDKEWGKK